MKQQNPNRGVESGEIERVANRNPTNKELSVRE